jgi:hypothetical protein
MSTARHACHRLIHNLIHSQSRRDVAETAPQRVGALLAVAQE